MTDTMTDGPPPAGPSHPLAELRRSDSDRWVAGVAGGLGRHLDVAPWIVRLAWVVAAGFGFGVPLYVIAWLLLPTDTRPSIAAEHRWNRNTIIGVCLIVAFFAVLTYHGTRDWWHLLPWMFIGLGVFLLVREHGTRPASLTPDGGAPAAGPIEASAVTAPLGTPITTPTTTGPPPAAARPVPPPGPPPPPRPRRTPFLTPLTLFGLIGLVGAAVLAGGRGWARPGVIAAVSLCALGAVLIVSAFLGRARGLIVVGVLVAVPLLIGLALGPRWDDWHNRTYTPTGTAELHRTYDRGIGRTVLDLRHVHLSTTHTTVVTVDQAIGQVEVYLPPDTTTNLRGHVSFGDIEVDGSDDDGGGTSIEVDRTLTTGDGTATLDLHLRLTAGQIRVRDASLVTTKRGPTPTLPPIPTAPAGGN